MNIDEQFENFMDCGGSRMIESIKKQAIDEEIKNCILESINERQYVENVKSLIKRVIEEIIDITDSHTDKYAGDEVLHLDEFKPNLERILK